MNCGRKSPVSESLRQYQIAIEVVGALKAQGKLKDICRDSAIQIPLFKNIICRIYNNFDIQLFFGKPTTKKLDGHIEVKI